MKRLDRLSRSLELVGRTLIHVSLDPLTWSAGVMALWLHKQLQATEIGHAALHGAYDKLPDAEAFASKTFAWDVPETLRDLCTAATIICGHVGPEVASWPEGTKSTSRGAWYAMQIEATNNFEVPRPVSILCGGLAKQIEHHLFPTLPPERLRQIAPEVRKIAERHGFRYRSESWGLTLNKALGHVNALAESEGAHAVLREVA